jgi:uncharacterized Zn-binding protein involved in type VI secretion
MAAIGRARIGDIVVGTGTHFLPCCPHTLIGVFVSGSGTKLVNGLGAVRVGDIFVHNCPHGHSIGFIISGSSLVTANNIGVGRIGDICTFTCPQSSGNVSSGSPNVLAG